MWAGSFERVSRSLSISLPGLRGKMLLIFYVHDPCHERFTGFDGVGDHGTGNRNASPELEAFGLSDCGDHGRDWADGHGLLGVVCRVGAAARLFGCLGQAELDQRLGLPFFIIDDEGGVCRWRQPDQFNRICGGVDSASGLICRRAGPLRVGGHSVEDSFLGIYLFHHSFGLVDDLTGMPKVWPMALAGALAGAALANGMGGRVGGLRRGIASSLEPLTDG
jgi:hypothetical protein